MLRKHVRRPSPMPAGAFWIIECSCGWLAKVPIHGQGRALSMKELGDKGEKLWLDHVPPRERRVYLLCDTRPPEEFRSLDEIRTDLRDAALFGSDGKPTGRSIDERVLDLQARAKFKAQRAIRGNFLMPEGTPVHLISTEERGGLHYGRFTVKGGHEQELPIGEVRLADGKVIAVDE